MKDQAYLEWLRGQPCIVCWRTPSEAAHVRLNGRGGMGMKPLFSAVPLCHQHHHQQHTKGHLSLMTEEEWLFNAGECLRDWLIDSV